jgi:hypothetical protein
MNLILPGTDVPGYRLYRPYGTAGSFLPAFPGITLSFMCITLYALFMREVKQVEGHYGEVD